MKNLLDNKCGKFFGFWLKKNKLQAVNFFSVFLKNILIIVAADLKMFPTVTM